MRKTKLLEFLSLANRNPRIYALVLGLFACLMMSPFAYFASTDIPFMLDGESVEARIVARRTAVRTQFSTRQRYLIEYRDAFDQIHSGAVQISDESLEAGDTIPIRYLRSDPARSRSEVEMRRSWPTMAFALITVVVLAASIWSGVSGMRDILRQLSRTEIKVPSR